MSLQKAVANALSFAHLSGIGRGTKAAKAEGDKPEDEDKDKAAADDEPEDKPKKDDEAKAESDDGNDKEPDDDKDDKKAGASAEDADDEMRGSSAVAQARVREQSRCAAIFASPAAAKNPVLAARLAFQTRTPRAEALALLEGTPAPAAAAATNPSRAARNPNVGTSGGQQLSPAQAAASRWDANLKAATPANRRRA